MTVLLLFPGRTAPAPPPGAIAAPYETPLDPRDLRDLLEQTKAERVVIAHHGEALDRAEAQRAAIRAGLDPLAVGWVCLDALDAGQTPRALAAAVANARAFAGSQPEHLRPRPTKSVSRRALLRGLLLEYDAVPAVDAAACQARTGCDLCVKACPASAIQIKNGLAEHDVAACLVCGRCVTACPTGATTNPIATPEIIESGVRALVERGAEGIAFHCRSNIPPGLPPQWSAVAVPCVGMLTPSWLIAPLLMGAQRTARIACREPCQTAASPKTTDAVLLARDILAAADLPPGLIADEAQIDLPAPSALRLFASLDGPFRHDGAPRVFRALAEAVGRDFVSQTPAGLARVEVSAACTLCGACSGNCPTGALSLAGEADPILSFRADTCVACHRCESVCPEKAAGAIRAIDVVDTAALRAPPVELRRGANARCTGCGRPVAPQAMMDRLFAILGERPAWASLCLDCRATGGAQFVRAGGA